jgi:hypothetical protein
MAAKKSRLKIYEQVVSVVDASADGELKLTVRDEGSGKYVILESEGFFVFEKVEEINHFSEKLKELIK